MNKYKKIFRSIFAPMTIAQRLIKAQVHGGDLKCVQDHTASIGKTDYILFATVRNEALLIDHFIAYYESLGVDHFIFIDNASEDGFLDLVGSRENVSVFYTNKSYKAANFGVHWLNYLLKRFGSDHWCITCDIDEYIVFPESEFPNLSSVVNKLEEHKQCSLFALLVDMYSKEHINSNRYKSGEDPLKNNRYFDKSGYVSSVENYRTLWVRGGVRLRVVFDGETAHNIAPSLNKIPLIKWRSYYCYLNSMHNALPGHLNSAHLFEFTAAMLHFKFLTRFREKVEDPLIRADFPDEYLQYDKLLETDSLYALKHSVEYEDYQTLFECGLAKYNNQYNHDLFKG